MKIIKATTDEQFAIIERLAKIIWTEHYKDIISKEQIEYMLWQYQSFDAILEAVYKGGYEYYLFYDKENPIGYMGIKPHGDRLFLSKLYILKDYRGKGYARRAIDFMNGYCMMQGLRAIFLTCNKKNPSLQVYEKLGFKKIDEASTDIGHGYVMDDYIMERSC